LQCLFQQIQSSKTELIANVYQIKTRCQQDFKKKNHHVSYIRNLESIEILVKDVQRDLKEEEQEVMIELKLKTNEFLKKLKEQTKKDRVRM